MRILQLLIAALCVAAGVVFGALNPQGVALDFGPWRIDAAPLGLSLLLAMLVGAILGGLVLGAFVIWPLRRRVYRLERRNGADESAETAVVEPARPTP
ncbi:lipopolysaccharide assembly protein LapA domain-containing protein [Coralloluteibacterium stylophorae]|uniref:DUF1049 domain-containing protein n=1 Tax=Coralloluteibacterium stylophorae TaxID=1776034 RepID=A0A8J8AZJ0_9GAMM|nr:lipopolysaccharide assembly protein LapA domain-containing protein [Coralloluteibacterium stylophorae]MBS7455978.1 DUF1049 domain-containing protein [Coralloluteibacterium stylophorae]